MANTEAAKARLESAVDRLENAVGNLRNRQSTDEATSKLSSEVQALRDERERLLRELDTMRADYRKLREITATVSNRLDHAIGDLKSMRGA